MTAVIPGLGTDEKPVPRPGSAIRCTNCLIDLGPEGGDEGGYLVYQGKPEGILSVKKSFTAQYLKPKLTEGKN